MYVMCVCACACIVCVCIRVGLRTALGRRFSFAFLRILGIEFRQGAPPGLLDGELSLRPFYLPFY